MKLICLLFFFLFFNQIGLCQKAHSAHIQYIELSDTSLINEIKKVIAKEVNSNDPEFFFKRDFGYVEVRISEFSQGDTIMKVEISPALSGIQKGQPDFYYPNYYSYIDGKLILIYSRLVRQLFKIELTNSTKNKIRKKVLKVLPKPEKKTLYDINGKVISKNTPIRIDYFKFYSEGSLYFIKTEKGVVVRKGN
ncbi:hypothetical protein [Rubrolithibacter danxiaensis]|uniref:hypothetical protein n=1 Tax=Rubrolithibacter danxiaensis TaxID=3390805 RepID=UPI003BF87F3B